MPGLLPTLPVNKSNPSPAGSPLASGRPLSNDTKLDLNLPSLSSSLSSRMDHTLLETNPEDAPMDLPSAAEVDDLLKDDSVSVVEEEADGAGAFSPLSDPDSPTAAVKAAIDAQMSENLISLEATSSLSTVSANLNVSNKNDSMLTAPKPLPLPTPAPKPKPLPLFPDGLPSFVKPTLDHHPRGTSSNKGQGSDKTQINPSYATKAKTPPKAREVVSNILHVYSSQVSKNPISHEEWLGIDSLLIEAMADQAPDDPVLVRIANSGYDAAHRCGYIACRDLASENWCKNLIGVGGIGRFRAWAKGEHPVVRTCRLFFPSRFDALSDDKLILLLKRHNPAFQKGILTLKSSLIVQGGRAIFLDLDTNLYAYVKSKGHKVEFSMMDIDCQLYIPPSNKVPSKTTIPATIPGITRIVRPPTSSSSSSSQPSSANSDQPSPSGVSTSTTSITSGAPDPVLNSVILPKGDPRKRGRPTNPVEYKDGHKKPSTSQRSVSNNKK